MPDTAKLARFIVDAHELGLPIGQFVAMTTDLSELVERIATIDAELAFGVWTSASAPVDGNDDLGALATLIGLLDEIKQEVDALQRRAINLFDRLTPSFVTVTKTGVITTVQPRERERERSPRERAPRERERTRERTRSVEHYRSGSGELIATKWLRDGGSTWRLDTPDNGVSWTCTIACAGSQAIGKSASPSKAVTIALTELCKSLYKAGVMPASEYDKVIDKDGKCKFTNVPRDVLGTTS